MRLKIKRLFSLIIGGLLLCIASVGFAASYNLSSGEYPPCSTSWSVSADTYTCTGDGRVSLGHNDTVTASRASTLRANNGFSLGNGQIGSASASIALLSTYGTVTSSSGAVVFGDIQANARIELTDATVAGNLRAINACIYVTGSSITGSVSASNGCSEDDPPYAISLTDTDVTGAISSSNGLITASGGTLRGNISGGCCDISLSNLSLYGNVSAVSADILLSRAQVTGNLNTTNRVSLDKSTVNGNVTAATWNDQTIKGTGNSFIYGVCIPSATTPAKLCSGEEPVAGVHHYRLSFASQALTCQAQTVVVSACMNAECSTVSSSASTLTITPSGTVMTFTGQGTGSVAVRTAQTVILSVSAASPAPSNPTLCQVDGVVSANCSMTFNDSGFVMRDLSPLVAGKPRTATIQAVRKSDSSPGCAPAFSGGPRTLQFSAHYVEPAGPSGTARALRVGSTNLAPGGPAQNVSLMFDSSATAPFPVTYLDAGVVRLSAAFTGTTSSGPNGQSEAGLQMTGTAELVSRPFGLCLETDLAHDSAKRFAGVAGGETVHVAGDAFELRVRAVAWTPADEADLDASAPRQPRICANPTTPNYQQAGIRLTHAVLEPDPPASDGSLTIKSYVHQRGERTVLAGQKIDEVGVFQLTAEPPAYFGYSMSHGVSQSGRIGRFIPARFTATGVGSLDSCDGLSYQGEPLKYAVVPSLTVTALNRAGTPARNYDRGDFWRLSRPAEQWFTQETGRDVGSRLSHNRRLVENGADDGDGTRVFTSERNDPSKDWDLNYARSSSPGSADLAFSLRQYYPEALLVDQDGVCHLANGNADCDGYALDLSGGDIRLGRLQIGNAHGSELENLALPWRIQSWQAPGAFLTEAKDSCSSAEWLPPNLDDITPGLEGHTSLESGVVQGHQGVLVLLAPGRGHTGSATAGFPYLPDWLWYDWQGKGREASRGLASFGIYHGPKPLIFRREVYRGM